MTATRQLRVYIAGPIKGMPNGNREAFAAAATELKALGFAPVNPWEIPPGDHPGQQCIGEPVDGAAHHYGCYLRADIVELLACDAITMLPGWDLSKGASTEHHVAASIGLRMVVL